MNINVMLWVVMGTHLVQTPNLDRPGRLAVLALPRPIPPRLSVCQRGRLWLQVNT